MSKRKPHSDGKGRKMITVYDEQHYKIKALAAMDRRSVPSYLEGLIDKVYETYIQRPMEDVQRKRLEAALLLDDISREDAEREVAAIVTSTSTDA